MAKANSKRHKGKTSKFFALQQDMIQAASHLANCGFHAALAGNLSIRVEGNLFLCSRHGADKKQMSLEDLVLCDAQENVVEGDGKPTSELSMHLAAYRERADVHAVIHAHPPTATAFAAASVDLNGLMLPEMVVYLGPVALVPYATPGTVELAERLRPYLANHNAFLLENHGALTLGKDIHQAAQRMELMEQNAIVSLHLKQLGQPFRLKSEELEALDRLRQRLTSIG